MVPYTDATLPSDNWLCKDIGDFINSTPLVVGDPPYYYPFDNYYDFFREIAYTVQRESTVPLASWSISSLTRLPESS